MGKLSLDRQALSKFLPTHEAIVTFEKTLLAVGDTLPDAIEQTQAIAASAIAAAAAAIGRLAEVTAQLEALAAAPLREFPAVDDDTAPRPQLGSIASQNYDAVDIEGGSIDNTPIGATTPAAATVTTLNKITFTQPATAATFTLANGKTLTVSNTLTLTAADGATLAIGAGGTLGSAAYTASTAYAPAGGGASDWQAGKFGCNGKTPQAAAASGGTLSGVIAALVANGILSS